MCCMSNWALPLVSGAIPSAIFVIFFFLRRKATNADVARLLFDISMSPNGEGVEFPLIFLRKEIRKGTYNAIVKYMEATANEGALRKATLHQRKGDERISTWGKIYHSIKFFIKEQSSGGEQSDNDNTAESSDTEG